MASSSISTRCSKRLRTASSLCGGRGAGTNKTWSSRACSRACSARIRWPWWTGSKLPPKTPTRTETPREVVSRADSGPDRRHPLERLDQVADPERLEEYVGDVVRGQRFIEIAILGAGRHQAARQPGDDA